MKLPSAMLASVAEVSGVPDAVVYCEAAFEATCMNFYHPLTLPSLKILATHVINLGFAPNSYPQGHPMLSS
jgi:hypothetical protein